MPLAIELAAAWVGTASVEQIAGRLAGSLELLEGRGPDRHTPRQRTMEGALNWSYELLSDGEKALFGRSAVFFAREVWVMNADGTGKRRVAANTGGDASPSWSPDGKKIVFSRNSTDIWVVNADGTGQKRLTFTPHSRSATPPTRPTAPGSPTRSADSATSVTVRAST